MTKEVIDKNLDDLAKVVQIIRKFRDTGLIPEIEKDIVITKLQSIYECVQQIGPEKIVQEVAVTQTPAHVAENKPSNTATPVSSPKEEKVPVQNIKEEVTTTPKETTNPGQKLKEAVKSKRQNPKIGTKHEVKTEILADQFQSTSFLNDALSQYNKMNDLSKKIQSRPLKDISTAIGLNEKFLFIKELFNNNATLYQSTIDKLNNFPNFNEAIQFIDDAFEWDFDNEQVQTLLELVQRRYTTG